MRGDTGLAARLLLRRDRLAALVIASGGGVALAGALRPWHALVADVAMLGGESRVTLPVKAGPDVWQAWLCVVLSAVVVWIGVLLALDRTSDRARLVTLTCGTSMAALAASAVIFVPGAEALAPERATELSLVAGELPVGIELRLLAVATFGPWLVVVGAVTAILGALRVREG